MRLLLIFFLTFFPILLSSQNTFIKIFDLDAPGSGFYNSTLVEDTLVVTGTVKNPDFFQWGTSWTQLDTLGNVLSQKIHYDTLEDTYLFSDGFEMIKTSDNGYAMVGSLFFRDYGFLLKMDSEGSLDFFQEYPDPEATNYTFQKVLEVEGGYIVTGGKPYTFDKGNAFIMKTDEEGNKLWEIIYGELDLYDGFPSIHKLENNELLLIGYTYTGSSTSPSADVPWPDEAINKHKFLRISSNGDILEEWENTGELVLDNENSIVIRQMQRDEEGNFIQAGRIMHLEYISPDPEPFTFHECQIIKRDPDFNIIWNTPVGNHRGGGNQIHEIIPTQDNSWLGVGGNWVESDGENRGYFAGFITKVDDYGNHLWTRTDTAFYAANPENNTISHTFNSVVTLPSGSIIATGRIENSNENPSRSYGWMIKLDKDGCLTPGCHPNLTGVNFSNLLTSFELFPNPTSDYVTVEGSGAFSTEVYDSIGRRVLDRQAFVDSGTLDFSLLPKGVYFVNIQTEGHLILSKKVSRL